MGFEIFEPANMIVVLANIIFFMLIQTAFFEFEASKHFNIVLANKAKIAQEYLQYDKRSALKYQKFKSSPTAKNLETQAKEQLKKRNEENMELMLNWIGIPLFIAIFILIVFIAMIFLKDAEWDKVDTILIFFVVFAYVAEILFYFGIVCKYQFYGDNAIYSGVYHEMENYINKEPVTEKGKEYKIILDTVIDKLSKTTMTIDEMKRIYNENRKYMNGITEDFFMTYANAKLKNVSEYINPNILDNIGMGK